MITAVTSVGRAVIKPRPDKWGDECRTSPGWDTLCLPSRIWSQLINGRHGTSMERARGLDPSLGPIVCRLPQDGFLPVAPFFIASLPSCSFRAISPERSTSSRNRFVLASQAGPWRYSDGMVSIDFRSSSIRLCIFSDSFSR